jgi:hypothetical protein
VAPVFENRWHRFLLAAQDVPVTYPVTVPPSPHLPPLSPTTQNSKRRGREGDFMAIWGLNRGIQGVKQESGPPIWWDGVSLGS